MFKKVDRQSVRKTKHFKIRKKISGTAERPRMSVYRSLNNIFVQIIDDVSSQTLVASHSKAVKGKTLLEKSVFVGKDVAEKAKAKKITKVVFDRGGFRYTGAVKALADGAREGGLKF